MEEVYEELLSWPLNEQARYLRGFFDGEGGPRFYRYKQRKGHHVPNDPHVRAVDLSNSDKRLINTIQQMLKNLGIKSRIYLDARKGERRATVDSWRLKILDRKSIIKFTMLVGFTEPKKKSILQQIIASYREHGS
ncbi:hypothetical protein B6U84_04475 [Candidatus Bathyarchaeota archaeon ex4484_40]|nr:MAG: hypothetical protein B6U84_04475 [Candidatus Bathyarchaeota archaeon ex4484_40]